MSEELPQSGSHAATPEQPAHAVVITDAQVDSELPAARAQAVLIGVTNARPSDTADSGLAAVLRPFLLALRVCGTAIAVPREI